MLNELAPIARFHFVYSIKSMSEFAIVDSSASDFAPSPDNQVIMPLRLSVIMIPHWRVYPRARFISLALSQTANFEQHPTSGDKSGPTWSSSPIFALPCRGIIYQSFHAAREIYDDREIRCRQRFSGQGRTSVSPELHA